MKNLIFIKIENPSVIYKLIIVKSIRIFFEKKSERIIPLITVIKDTVNKVSNFDINEVCFLL